MTELFGWLKIIMIFATQLINRHNVATKWLNKKLIKNIA